MKSLYPSHVTVLYDLEAEHFIMTSIFTVDSSNSNFDNTKWSNTYYLKLVYILESRLDSKVRIVVVFPCSKMLVYPLLNDATIWLGSLLTRSTEAGTPNSMSQNILERECQLGYTLQYVSNTAKQAAV